MLTNLDKKILFSLDENGRKSYSQIANEIGSTPQVVKYRFENLLERGIIKNFWAFIDYNRVGYDYFWAYWFTFTGADKEKREEIFTYLKNRKNIPIVFRTDGFADGMIAIIAKDLFEHNKVLSSVLEKLHEHVLIKETSIGVSFTKFARGYLTDKKDNAFIFKSGKITTETIPLDEIDTKIISLTQINGRIKFSEIAKVLQIDINKARRHYEKLLKKEVIQTTVYTLNPKHSGVKMFRILVKLSHRKKILNNFFDFCAKHPNITTYIKTIGNFQAMLDVEIYTREELRSIIQDMYQNFTNLIYRIEINEIYEVEKFSQMTIEHPEFIDSISKRPWDVSGID